MWKDSLQIGPEGLLGRLWEGELGEPVLRKSGEGGKEPLQLILGNKPPSPKQIHFFFFSSLAPCMMSAQETKPCTV